MTQIPDPRPTDDAERVHFGAPRRLALLTPYDAARLGLMRSGFGVDELIDHERTAAELEAAAFLVITDPPDGDALTTAGGHVGAAGLRSAVAAQLTDPDGEGIGDLTWIVRATWNGSPPAEGK